MSETKPKATPQFDRQLLQQLLAERQTAGEIEDLLKDLRKAFIEHALQGELTHHLGYEKHAAAGPEQRQLAQRHDAQNHSYRRE